MQIGQGYRRSRLRQGAELPGQLDSVKATTGEALQCYIGHPVTVDKHLAIQVLEWLEE